MSKLKAMWRILICQGFVVFTEHPTAGKCLAKVRNYDLEHIAVFGKNQFEQMLNENERN